MSSSGRDGKNNDSLWKQLLRGVGGVTRDVLHSTVTGISPAGQGLAFANHALTPGEQERLARIQTGEGNFRFGVLSPSGSGSGGMDTQEEVPEARDPAAGGSGKVASKAAYTSGAGSSSYLSSSAAAQPSGGGGGGSASRSTAAQLWLQPTPEQLYQRQKMQQQWQQQKKAEVASGSKGLIAAASRYPIQILLEQQAEEASGGKVAQIWSYPTESLLSSQGQAAASGRSTTSIPGVSRGMIGENIVARSPLVGALLKQHKSNSALPQESVLLSLKPERRRPATTRKIRIVTINQYERIMRLYLTDDQQIRLLRAVNYDGPLVKYIPDINYNSGKEFFMYDFIKKVLTEVSKGWLKKNKTRRIGAIKVQYMSNKKFESILSKYNTLL